MMRRYAMSQRLPVGQFRWVGKDEHIDFSTLDDDSNLKYFIKCDLEYPSTLHDYLMYISNRILCRGIFCQTGPIMCSSRPASRQWTDYMYGWSGQQALRPWYIPADLSAGSEPMICNGGLASRKWTDDYLAADLQQAADRWYVPVDQPASSKPMINCSGSSSKQWTDEI